MTDKLHKIINKVPDNEFQEVYVEYFLDKFKRKIKRDKIHICSCGKRVKHYNRKRHKLSKYHIKYDNNPKIILNEYAFI